MKEKKKVKNLTGKVLKGKDISNIFTLGTQYDNGNIGIRDNKQNEYRLSVSEIAKFVKQNCFVAETKRTLTHLKLVEYKAKASLFGKVESCADVDFQCEVCPARYKCITE